MKFKVETIIPQRQYENIHTSYEIELGAEPQGEWKAIKDNIIKIALDDLRAYNSIIQRDTPPCFYNPKEGEEVISSGIKYTFKDGSWQWEKQK